MRAPRAGSTGTTNETQFFNNAPESLEESLAKLDEIGGPTTFNHYPWGWTWAGNTPFRRWKRETYRGGASDPFLVHWPAGIAARGEVRQQYAHIIDMVPTVLDVLGIEPPATIRGVTQAPLHGVSFAHTFDDADAPTRHYTQYFEMFGHRAIDHNGWRAVCPWPGPSFAEADVPFGTPITADTLAMLDAERWELYHAAEDFAENYDVAAENRGKVIELIAQWYVEAGRYNVLPIDGSVVTRLMTERPQLTEARTSYTFWPGTEMLPASVGPRVLNRPHSITADVDIPAAGAEGVLLCQGANNGGFAFYVQGPAAALRPQLPQPRDLPRVVAGSAARGQSPAAVRVRAHRRTGLPQRPRGAGPGPALRRRSTRGPDRHPGDRPDRVQPGRPVVRIQPRGADRDRLPVAVPVHRDAAPGDGRRERRAHHRQRSGDANGDVPAVGGRGPAGGGCNCDLSRRRAASRVRCRRAGGAPTTTPVR